MDEIVKITISCEVGKEAKVVVETPSEKRRGSLAKEKNPYDCKKETAKYSKWFYLRKKFGRPPTKEEMKIDGRSHKKSFGVSQDESEPEFEMVCCTTCLKDLKKQEDVVTVERMPYCRRCAKKLEVE